MVLGSPNHQFPCRWPTRLRVLGQGCEDRRGGWAIGPPQGGFLTYTVLNVRLPDRPSPQIPSSTHTKQRVGYAIFSLYIAQVFLGIFIHAVHVPFLSIAHRSLQNYLHAVLGLAILAMAAYQVRVFRHRLRLILPDVGEIDSQRTLRGMARHDR